MEAASGLFTYPRNVHVDFTKLDVSYSLYYLKSMSYDRDFVAVYVRWTLRRTLLSQREALFKVIKFYGGGMCAIEWLCDDVCTSFANVITLCTYYVFALAVPPNTTSNLDLACLAAR
jgi:hypothetical protein